MLLDHHTGKEKKNALIKSHPSQWTWERSELPWLQRKNIKELIPRRERNVEKYTERDVLKIFRQILITVIN